MERSLNFNSMKFSKIYWQCDKIMFEFFFSYYSSITIVLYVRLYMNKTNHSCMDMYPFINTSNVPEGLKISSFWTHFFSVAKYVGQFLSQTQNLQALVSHLAKYGAQFVKQRESSSHWGFLNLSCSPRVTWNVACNLAFDTKTHNTRAWR